MPHQTPTPNVLLSPLLCCSVRVAAGTVV